jgi:transposase
MQRIPNRQYTVEFQAAAVKQVTEGGRRVVDVAQSLDLSPKTLGNWVRRARAGHTLSTGGQPRGVTDVQAELSRLRTENAQLTLDKEILKKAAAYFARESR